MPLRCAFLGWPSRVIEDEAMHRNILASLFLTGITLVALEDVVKLDKAAIMLVLASDAGISIDF